MKNFLELLMAVSLTSLSVSASLGDNSVAYQIPNFCSSVQSDIAAANQLRVMGKICSDSADAADMKLKSVVIAERLNSKETFKRLRDIHAVRAVANQYYFTPSEIELKGVLGE